MLRNKAQFQIGKIKTTQWTDVDTHAEKQSGGIKCTVRAAAFSTHSISPFQSLCASTFHIILCLLLHSLYKETAMLFTCHALTPQPILSPDLHLFISLHSVLQAKWQSTSFTPFLVAVFSNCYFSFLLILTFSTKLAPQIYMHKVLLLSPSWQFQAHCNFVYTEHMPSGYWLDSHINTLLAKERRTSLYWHSAAPTHLYKNTTGWQGRWGGEKKRKINRKKRGRGLPSFSMCCLIYKPIGFSTAWITSPWRHCSLTEWMKHIYACVCTCVFTGRWAHIRVVTVRESVAVHVGTPCVDTHI